MLLKVVAEEYCHQNNYFIYSYIVNDLFFNFRYTTRLSKPALLTSPDFFAPIFIFIRYFKYLSNQSNIYLFISLVLIGSVGICPAIGKAINFDSIPLSCSALK